LNRLEQYSEDSPWVTAHINILSIPANGDPGAFRDIRVDRVQIPESIRQDFEVCQRLAVARLQCRAVTVRIDIKNRNGSEDGVAIYAGSAVVHVDIGHNMCAIPEALKEAEDLWRLVTACACHTEMLGELGAFDEGSVLILDGEEAGSLGFFPEVESSLVPVLSDVRQIVRNYWPYLRFDLLLDIRELVSNYYERRLFRSRIVRGFQCRSSRNDGLQSSIKL
jgi:hypothetical protein